MENTRSLVLSLIKEDLRCSKLVLGLSELGLDAGKYHTELSNIVFDLMEIEVQNDSLLTLYFDNLERVAQVHDVEDMRSLALLAEDIYTKLLEAKHLRSY